MLKASKNNHACLKVIQLMCTQSWRGCADGVLHILQFTVFCFKLSVKKHCVAEVLLADWDIFFIFKIIFNCDFYNLDTNLLLFFLCSFVEPKNKNQVFSRLVVSFLFITTHALLQKHSNCRDFL